MSFDGCCAFRPPSVDARHCTYMTAGPGSSCKQYATKLLQCEKEAVESMSISCNTNSSSGTGEILMWTVMRLDQGA